MKFGGVRFPGSCDDVDALHAARHVADAVLLWHAEPDLQGVDAVIVPGGSAASSTRRPTWTLATPSKPSAGSARSTAWPCASRMPAFGRMRTRTLTCRCAPARR